MDRKGETREQRAARMKATKEIRQKIREGKIKILQDARKAAYEAFKRNAHWQQQMLDILKQTEMQKDKLTTQKNTKILENKSNTDLKTIKEKEIALHNEKTTELTFPNVNWSAKLEAIDKFCKDNSLENIVGTTVPTALSDNQHYLFVALDFLGQVKKQIMTSIRSILLRKLRSGEMPKDKDSYLFINSSNLANTLRKQLSKDKYPKKPKKYLPDRAALIEWTTRVRKLELAAFKATHGKKAKIPKRLRNGPPPKGRRHMVVYPHGRGRPPMYFMPMPMPMYQPQYGRRGRNNYHKHGKKGRRSYNPTYNHGGGGDPFSPRQMEPEQGYASNRGGGYPQPNPRFEQYDDDTGYGAPAASRMYRRYF